jgi:hypothetical protein
MMTTRIYIVRNGASDPRLVRAENQAQVGRHIVKPYEIEVASQDALIAALGKGVKVEEAKTEDDAE